MEKFPNTVSLGIDYGVFLLMRMNYRKQALNELSNAEKSRPSYIWTAV
jgi:hypothetical protein